MSEEFLEHVRVTFRRIEADTKQAAIKKLQMIGIEAEDKWWSDAVYTNHRRKSGRIEHTTFTMKAVPSTALNPCFIEMHPSMDPDATGNVHTRRNA